MSDFDSMDAAILDVLQERGRLSNAKLAQRVRLSETPCWKRVKRLEKAGVIEGYRAVLNRRKLDLGVLAFVHLGCDDYRPEVIARMHEMVEASPNVLACHNITGDADFLLVVVARDLDDYSRFAERVLRNLPGITTIKSNLSMRELKSSTLLPITQLPMR